MSEQDKENKIVPDEERENAASVQEELSAAANDADGVQVEGGEGTQEEGFPLGGSCPKGTDEGNGTVSRHPEEPQSGDEGSHGAATESEGIPQSAAPHDGMTEKEGSEGADDDALASPVQGEVDDADASDGRVVEGSEGGMPVLPPMEKRERLTFAEKMSEAGYVVGRRYDAVKNAFLSYKSTLKRPKPLHCRFSTNSETFTVGKKLLAKLVLVSGYLRLFVALDPKAYNEQKYHHKDYTEVARYEKTPLMIKLSSDRQEKYAVELIDDLMRANNFEPDENYVPTDQADVFMTAARTRKKTKVVYVPVPVGGAGGDAAAETAAAQDGAQKEGFPLGGSCPEGTDEGDGAQETSEAPHPSAAQTPSPEGEGSEAALSETEELTPEGEGGEGTQDDDALTSPVQGEVDDADASDGRVSEGSEGEPAAPERESSEERALVPAPDAIDVKLPRRGRVRNKKGERCGKIRRSVWYSEEGDTRGEFRKEERNVFLYSDKERRCYVDKNNNILALDHTYVATIHRTSWLPILIIVIILAIATVLSVVLGAYFLNRSVDYAPVLFIAHEDGTQWQDEEDLPVFVNETFGDAKVAPGMEGSYRFSLRNDNDDALVFSLLFEEENEYGIGLVYKLKRDGVYVSGAEGHLSPGELGVTEMTIEARSTTVFEIEWYWAHNDEADTAAGEAAADYTLHIAFSAYVSDRA